MWKLQSFSNKLEGSDQSISDEDEEQDCSLPGKYVALAGTVDRKKESLGVASQLELLKGVRQDTVFSSEDEVELPDFDNQSNVNPQCIVEGDSISIKGDDSICEPDEQISRAQKGSKAVFQSFNAGDNASNTLNFYTRGKEKYIENCRQPAISEESRRLDPSAERPETGRWLTHHPIGVKQRNPSKGGRRKTAMRPSSHLQPYKKGVLWSLGSTDKDLSSASSDELLNESEAINSLPKEETIHYEDLNVDISNSRVSSPVGAVMEHDNSRLSVVELLDHLQGKNSKPYHKCKMVARRKERIRRHGMNGHLAISWNNLVRDEDAGEFMNSGSSTDHEDIAQDHKSDNVESGCKTMADKFHEAFGSAPVLDARPFFMAPKLSSSGLSGRLQHVMQLQKDQDTEFFKKQQTEVWPKDEARCIDVKILSKTFDAKLTVCHCSLIENEESSVQNPQQKSFQKTWTIIFNSRICNDVDLEVENLVRIHPPWKEVQVLRCGEIIILATYFSQI